MKADDCRYPNLRALHIERPEGFVYRPLPAVPAWLRLWRRILRLVKRNG